MSVRPAAAALWGTVRRHRVVIGIALAGVWVPLQGYLVFLWFGRGQFLSQHGIECTVIPAFVELVILVTSAMHHERLKTSYIANPHSQLGASLRNDAPRPHVPPPTRTAWDGEWEDPSKASDKMRPGR
jgi:stage V sporulation protein SpoVS